MAGRGVEPRPPLTSEADQTMDDEAGHPQRWQAQEEGLIHPVAAAVFHAGVNLDRTVRILGKMHDREFPQLRFIDGEGMGFAGSDRDRVLKQDELSPDDLPLTEARQTLLDLAQDKEEC
ncbi:MAG TPA: hypothetical protein EYQ80_01135 [Candidatus Poseidoniales archaeon]|nr:hypothetical protein [Candidatus Poseidoniales archaeon]